MFKRAKKTPPGPSLLSLILTPPPREPATFQLNLANRYGAICKMPGLFSFYLLSHPDYIERVLKTHYKNYLKADLPYKGIRSVLGDGLLCKANHDEWLTQRRLLQPLFQPQQLTHYSTVITQATLALCTRWEKYAKEKQAFNLLPEMLRLAFEIATQALFNGAFSPYLEQFLEFSELGNGYINKMLFLCPWLPTLHNRRFQRSQKNIHHIINTILQQHRSDHNSQHDLLTTLQELPPQQIYDEVMTFLITGYETTGTALTWAWYNLCTHPESTHQLQQEADRNDFSYARMVFEETLRLYPPIWMISRRAVDKDEMDGYTIPAGATVITSPYVMHHLPDYWPNPDAFDPLRFSEENKNSRPKFTYFPFGAGPRACIGGGYAMLEAQIILTTIAQHYGLELASKKKPKPEYLITLRPKKGLWIKIRKR